MAAELSPVPRRVAEIVTEYITSARMDRQKFENLEPLDTGDVWNLHAMARQIYAVGWRDGLDTAREMERGNRVG